MTISLCIMITHSAAWLLIYGGVWKYASGEIPVIASGEIPVITPLIPLILHIQWSGECSLTMQ